MSIFENIFGKKKESAQVSPSKPRFYLPDFEVYGEFGHIVTIFNYILNPDFVIANKAAYKINQLFNTVQLYKNKQLYETFRHLRILINQILSDKYYLIRILLIKHIDKVPDVRTILTKLLSDKSQKIRQKAVNLVAGQDLKEYKSNLGNEII